MTTLKHAFAATDAQQAFGPATSLVEVLDALQLVHDTYCAEGLITPRRGALHAHAHFLVGDTLTVQHQSGGRLVSTQSVFHDTRMGLPLDQVYASELTSLRRQGRMLCEVGLYADARRGRTASPSELFNLMRWTFFFACHTGCDDLMAGVHPHHAKFYKRLIGFTEAGPERTYPSVANQPVVLLRLNLDQCMKQADLPRGLAFFRDHYLNPEAFENRYRLTPRDIVTTPLRQFMRPRHWPLLLGRVRHGAA